MKKVTVSLVVVVIIFLVVLRLIDPRFDDIQELRDKGWIPLWAPEPKKLVSHSRDLNLNTSETVMFYEESEIEKLWSI